MALFRRVIPERMWVMMQSGGSGRMRVNVFIWSNTETWVPRLGVFITSSLTGLEVEKL